MNAKAFIVIACLSPAWAFAQGCDVVTRSQSDSVPAIDTHSCYEYQGMPGDSINWSCSNESKDMLSTSKNNVGQCADYYRATCLGTLTQEALANPRSISKDKNSKSINIPDNAQIITYYYDTEHLAQARIDCETGGGRWNAR
jgi:hypothetical protein